MKVHHDFIKEEIILLNNVQVEFDADGNADLEDVEYAELLCSDRIGFSKVPDLRKEDELVREEKEEKEEKTEDEPKSKLGGLIKRKALNSK